MAIGADDFEDSGLHLLPLEHELAPGESEHDVARSQCIGVAPSVTFERGSVGVVFASIEFENQAGSDQEIHYADAAQSLMHPKQDS